MAGGKAKTGFAAAWAKTRISKANENMAAQGSSGKTIAAAPTQKIPLAQFSMLRRLFLLATKRREFKQRDKNLLVEDLTKRIAACGTIIKPKYLGYNDWRQVAARIVRHFDEIDNLKKRTFRAFSRHKSTRGHEASLRGILFNEFIREFEPLWKALEQEAKTSVGITNNVTRHRKKGGLINARGREIYDAGRFSKKLLRGRELKICLRKVGRTGSDPKDVFYEDSVDDVLLTSAARKGGGRYWIFPIELESKAPSGQFYKQIGEAQDRFGADAVVEIEVTVKGRKFPIKISPDELVFDLPGSTRNAVSLLTGAAFAKDFKLREKRELTTALEEGNMEKIYQLARGGIQSTDKGMGIIFPRINLAMDVTELNKIIWAVTRGG